MHIDLLNLLSGSDIRGIAVKKEEQEPPLSDNAALKIGYTLNKWYEKTFGKKLDKVAIGRDPRITGEMLTQAVSLGLIAAGTNVIDVGLATSPAMFMLTQEDDIPLSIMITASHMPPEYNGIKILTPEGGLSSNQVKDILTIGEDIITDFTPGAKRTERDYLPDYAAHLVNIVREQTGEEEPLKGLKILVDPGNGSGGFFTDLVLKPLGADVTGSLFLEPDGNFPNHIPNPEEPENLIAITKALKETHADMAIVFDTDVDRCAIIDETGKVINKSRFIAFISSLLLEENPGATIVTDSVTSNSLSDFILKHGGKHHRFKRGYKNVIDEAKRLNEEGTTTILAMETSGHGAVKNNYFLDDGAYLAVLSLIALYKANKKGHTLSSYLSDYKDPNYEEEVRYTILEPKFKDYGKEILNAFEEFGKTIPNWKLTKPNYEGIRFDVEDGWVLLRQSLHEPKLVANFEAEDEKVLKQTQEELDEFLSNYNLEK